MFCPRCDSDMPVVKDPYLIKHRCNNCEGIYVEKTQFKKLVKEISGSDLNLFPEPEKDDIHPTIHCPECSSVEMAKKLFQNFLKLFLITAQNAGVCFWTRMNSPR